jgi:hypothetical protein
MRNLTIGIQAPCTRLLQWTTDEEEIGEELQQ